MTSARTRKTSKLSLQKSAPRELELKLTVTPDVLARIRKGGVLARLAGLKPLGRASTRRLRSVYWDTPAHDLAAAGLGLRVRDDGGIFVQTLKSEDAGGGLVSDRGEDETLLAAADHAPEPDLRLITDKQLRRRARKARGKASLAPLFASVVERTERRYETDTGDRFAVVFDEGHVELEGVPHICEPLCEIEIERIAGSPAALISTARALAARYPLAPGTRSKAARGYALAAKQAGGGTSVTPSAVIEKAGRSVVVPGMTLRQAYAVTLTRSTDQIVGNLEAVRDHRLPVGVHQMRVAIRRLRAAHAVFRKVIPLADASLFIAQVKTLFAVLGEARDLDVFCTETLPCMATASPGAGLETLLDLVPLAAAAQELRTAAWDRVLEAVRAPEFTLMLLQAGGLTIAASGATADDMSSDRGMALARFARDRLAGQWQRAVIAHHDLAGLDNDARHDLRKRLKTLRYEAEFFAPLWSVQDTKPFMRQLKRVQNDLGVINDAATAMQIAHRAADEIGGERSREAAGFVAGWYAARAEAAFDEVMDMWPGFETLEGFWCRRPIVTRR